VGQIGLLIVTAVRWRRTPSSVRWRRMLGAASAILNIIFLAGLVRTLLHTDAANPLLLGFGIPTSALPWFVLPVVSSTLGISVVIARISTARRGARSWRQGHDVLAGAATLGFVGWLAYWDLLLFAVR
jgi:hypothetical protein